MVASVTIVNTCSLYPTGGNRFEIDQIPLIRFIARETIVDCCWQIAKWTVVAVVSKEQIASPCIHKYNIIDRQHNHGPQTPMAQL